MLINANHCRLNIRRVLLDPEFYLFDYDKTADQSEFLLIDEDSLDRAAFVDGRVAQFAKGRFAISNAEIRVLESMNPHPRPTIDFIFHHSFVCSTLLARSLSSGKQWFGLKEPWVLRRLADLKRSQSSSFDRQRLEGALRQSLRLLAKPYRGGNRVLIKATNLANNLLPDILALPEQHRALYLYSDLESFLVSNLRKPLATREKIPRLLEQFVDDIGFSHPELVREAIADLPFEEVCGWLWVVSNQQVLETASDTNSRRLATLSMDRWLNAPAASLLAISNLFDQPLGPADIQRMTSSSVLGRHAKDLNETYDANAYFQEHARLKQRYRLRVDNGLAKIGPIAADLKIMERLSGLSVANGNQIDWRRATTRLA